MGVAFTTLAPLRQVLVLLHVLDKSFSLPFGDLAMLGQLAPKDEFSVLAEPLQRTCGVVPLREAFFGRGVDFSTLDADPARLIVIADGASRGDATDDPLVWHLGDVPLGQYLQDQCFGKTWRTDGGVLLSSVPRILPLPRVYQRFYTQLVRARCSVCGTSPSIPAICLMCGKYLCCTTECCAVRENGGSSVGEVTLHARSCGAGLCVFLQLANSMVYVLLQDKIALWGSLFLDSYGEEDQHLSKPLTLSSARLARLNMAIATHSFLGDSDLHWRKFIFI